MSDLNEKIQAEIETIMNNARASGREITVSQADAIRRRSYRLRKESEKHPIINPKTKARQIEECWKQHSRINGTKN